MGTGPSISAYSENTDKVEKLEAVSIACAKI